MFIEVNNPDKRDLNPILKLELDGILIFLSATDALWTPLFTSLMGGKEGEPECKFGFGTEGCENCSGMSASLLSEKSFHLGRTVTLQWKRFD